MSDSDDPRQPLASATDDSRPREDVQRAKRRKRSSSQVTPTDSSPSPPPPGQRQQSPWTRWNGMLSPTPQPTEPLVTHASLRRAYGDAIQHHLVSSREMALARRTLLEHRGANPDEDHENSSFTMEGIEGVAAEDAADILPWLYVQSPGSGSIENESAGKKESTESASASSGEKKATGSAEPGDASSHGQSKKKKKKKDGKKVALGDEDLEKLFSELDAGKIDLHGMCKDITLGFEGETLASERKKALDATLRGLPSTRPGEWVVSMEAFKRSTATAQELTLAMVQANKEKVVWDDDEFCVQIQLSMDLETMPKIDGWVAAIMRKIGCARFALRWHLRSSHEPEWVAQMYRQIWATSDAGVKALGENSIEEPATQRLFARELTQSRNRNSREVVANNRLLQAYARMGAMVFFYPWWTMRGFKNENWAPSAQKFVIQVFNRLGGGKNTVAENQPAVERELLALIGCLAGDDAVEMMTNYLWELRRASLLDLDEADYTPPTKSYGKRVLRTAHLSPPDGYEFLPTVADGPPTRGRPRKARKIEKS